MKKTVLDMMDTAAFTWPDAPYALRKTDAGFVASSFSEAREVAEAFAAWLLQSGFAPGDKLAIIGEGSPAWLEGEFGAFYAGLVSVPLSIKLMPDEIRFRIDHSEAKILLTTHNMLETIARLLAEREGLPLTLVYLDEDIAWAKARAAEAGFATAGLVAFSEAVGAGKAALAEPSGALRARLSAVRADLGEDTVATISYTSGTMGNPKGIMLTHLNFWTNSHDLSIRFITPRFRTLLILPVDHSFIHTSAVFTALWSGVALYFVDARAGGIAMLKNIPLNIQECQPTFLFTVPALTLNFMKKIQAGVEQKGPVATRLFNAGMEAAAKWMGDGFHKVPLADKISSFLPYFLAKSILFGPIKKKALGGSIVFCISGGSKLDPKQQKFFTALGVPLLPGYGLTEAGPVVSTSVLESYKFGTVGILMPSTRCAILDEEGGELPQGETGEIAVAGDNVMKGYYRNPEATAAAFKDGYLLTGDLGFMDEDGFLNVVGRKRALLVSESGDKHSPEAIEDAMMGSTDLIEQSMAWCLYAKHPCALVTLDMAKTKAFIAERRIRTAEELCKALQDEFFRFKTAAGPRQIQPKWVPIAFQIVNGQFSEQDGTINSTMKLVRRRVEELYRELIDYSYTSEGSTTVNPRNIATLKELFKL